MSGVKLDIQCSPSHSDKFITIGTELNLYQIEEIKETLKPSNALKLSETHYANLLCTNSDYQYLKVVVCYPKADPEHLLAVGQANGKVVLTSFGNVQDPLGFIGKEFVPRHARQCNSLIWNPVECNLLAAGLDKYKADYSILVWDIWKCASQVGEPERRSGSNADTNSIKPVVELGLSEVTHSLHWFTHQPKTLIAGMSNRHLKIYDLRDTTKHLNSTSTKAVYGVCVDPHFEHRLASFVEGQVVIWDVRNFEKPVLTLNENNHIMKLGWCPTRNNQLAALGRDTNIVKLYDIQHTSLGSDELEPTVVERCVQPCGPSVISSFSWHPFQENRMLTITPGGIMKDYIVFERITLNWAPSSGLVWSNGKKILQYIDQKDNVYDSLDDVSIKMKQRALAGYGLKTHQLIQNGQLAGGDRKLVSLWSWLHLVKSLREEGRFKAWAKNYRFYGIRSVIRIECLFNGTIKSEPILQPWADLGGPYQNFTSKIYRSEERDKALLLCGWGFDRDGVSLQLLLERLENEGSYERAAAIVVFNLRILQAIEILKKGALKHGNKGDVNLNIVAMALSGYTVDKNALWQEQCNDLRLKLQNPYLRGMFAFLTSTDDSYEQVLNEPGIAMQDRIAFVCLFLPDNKLADYLEKLTTKMIESGNLDGILLTGVSKEGLDLLQRYVDLTADVQTASMIVLQALPSEISQDPRVHQWVESYRELLDQWRLWYQRAEFDVCWNKPEMGTRTPQQVFVSCNFCGKSISSYMQAMGRGRSNVYLRLGTSANKTKMTSCPGCRKPLPRCALCLMNMGTASGLGVNIQRASEEKLDEQRISRFSSWFTWCQSCRHGGHAGHMMEWFKEHTECPVTACSCKCMCLDSVSNLESQDSCTTVLGKVS